MNKIKLFQDGPTFKEIEEFENKVDGYTFNPTLFKKLGAEDYINFTKDVLKKTNNKSTSIEVIADTEEECFKQAKIIQKIHDSISVKIPIVYTNGESTIDLISKLIANDIKLNITAIFTLDQIRHILPKVKKTKTILSVFSGRLFDIGLNAEDIINEVSNNIHSNSDCKLLWASCRMPYDYIIAERSGADIITMPTEMIKKLEKFGKNPIDYSLETVKTFFNDAKNAKFKIN